jgi:acyl-coenzyme A synthetase/AMP-(fatty) acid ligase
MSESVADHFAQQADSQPDAPALIWDGREISYGELQKMADAAHAELEALGLPADRPVGIQARKSPEAIALILACLKARRPFLLPSIELAPETLAKLFGQAEASRVLTPAEDGDSALSASELPDDGDMPASEWPPPGGGDDIAFMLTTSGSTGLPKIVPLPAAAIHEFTNWAASQFGIGPGAKVLNYAPLNFDLCLLDIWSTLKAGGCVVIVDQAKATHGDHLVELIAGNEVDVVQAVPMLYRLLIDETSESGQRFPSVKHVITTGDKIPPSSLSQLPELFPNARIYNVYGCTETNDSMMHQFEGLSPEGGLSPSFKVPIGKPIQGVEARIEGEDGNPLEGAGTGELLVRTPFQTRGYLTVSRNEGTFVSRTDDGEGERTYYRTGDVVRRDEEGVLTLEGRSDFYVKVRGVRVSTQVVEQAIQEHPDAIEVAVIPVPDEIAGHKLHAVVRKKENSSFNGMTLRKHLMGRLARTEMPGSIAIVTEELPKTSTGKVDRNKIQPPPDKSKVAG